VSRSQGVAELAVTVSAENPAPPRAVMAKHRLFAGPPASLAADIGARDMMLGIAEPILNCRHVNHEAVFDILLERRGRLRCLLNADLFEVRRDAVFGAEVQISGCATTASAERHARAPQQIERGLPGGLHPSRN